VKYNFAKGNSPSTLRSSAKDFKPKNTECFERSYDPPSIRLLINSPIYNENEVSISDNLFTHNSQYLFSDLMSEIDKDVYKPWHNDSHLIADDNYHHNWKLHSDAFNYIIRTLSQFFCLTPSATRLNYYVDTDDWKPYHHDAAALKPEKAKTQNITVGVSIGATRDISFQSTHHNASDRVTIDLELKNSTVYAFGNKVNIDFKHGIPAVKQYANTPRISIIIWGYSSLIH